MGLIFQSAAGIVVFISAAWLLSEDRRRIPWRPILVGLVLQFLIALALLMLPVFRDFFTALNHVLLSLEQATQTGTSFVFGYLGGGDLPFEQTTNGSSFVLAFRALPLILVVSALSALLYYWRVLPWIVHLVSRALQRSMGIGGALGVGAAANLFVGMVEAPLFVRPYLKDMSRSELFALMTCGMATIAGTVMVLYASILSPVLMDAMGHVLTASLISAPAALLVALVMVPPGAAVTAGDIVPPQQANSSMDAITKGTVQGVQLLINIIAMLIVMVALVSLTNIMLGALPEVGGKPLTLQRMLGYLMAPVVWLMGVPWGEAHTAGALMGTKTILNEFLAYLELAALPPDALSARSTIIMTYA
ncbi:MAG: nucleoside:proton symporter, partial [Gammaproteobacteria bacterium]|nr:nucleoside:proton symporter [Gammaproteobacteria bacterium]